MTNLDRGIKMNPKVTEILDHALQVAEKSDKPQQDTICALVELVHFLANESKVVALSSNQHYERIKSDMVQKEIKPTLDMDKVLDIEKLGLSINRSAIVLGVTPEKLYYFINQHGIEWRGKGQCFKRGETNPNSDRQRALSAGLKPNTVMYRMLRRGISFDEALAMGGVK